MRIFAALILIVAAAACGGGSGGDDRAVIRFAFAPDPVWDYLADSGALREWEEEHDLRIETSSTWDEFTYFAGGHGDIVSMGTQEIPVLEAETNVETVTFGRYNYQRVPLLTRAGEYETLEDIPEGSTICVNSPVSNTGTWAVIAREMHGLDFRVDGGDFDLIVNDHFVNPTNLLRGDCEAATAIPEAAIPYLRSGEIEIMYDGQLPFQLYGSFSGVDDGEKHVMSNLFTATAEWYDSHQEEAAAFLELWQTGIELWEENQAEIIAQYPQHFSVEEDEDIEYMQEFIAEGENDWFADDVYLDEAWIEAETQVWDLMHNLDPDDPNYLAPDTPAPRFEVIEPPAE